MSQRRARCARHKRDLGRLVHGSDCDCDDAPWPWSRLGCERRSTSSSPATPSSALQSTFAKSTASLFSTASLLSVGVSRTSIITDQAYSASSGPDPRPATSFPLALPPAILPPPFHPTPQMPLPRLSFSKPHPPNPPPSPNPSPPPPLLPAAVPPMSTSETTPYTGITPCPLPFVWMWIVTPDVFYRVLSNSSSCNASNPMIILLKSIV